MEVHSHHFLHAVFDHLGGEEVGFSFLVHGDFPVVLQQDGADGLGGVGHVNGAVIANHLTEIGQGPAVVQVEMAEKSKKTPQNSAWVVPGAFQNGKSSREMRGGFGKCWDVQGQHRIRRCLT